MEGSPSLGTSQLCRQKVASTSLCAKARGTGLSLQKATSMDLPYKVPVSVSAKHKPHISGT